MSELPAELVAALSALTHEQLLAAVNAAVAHNPVTPGPSDTAAWNQELMTGDVEATELVGPELDRLVAATDRLIFLDMISGTVGPPPERPATRAPTGPAAEFADFIRHKSRSQIDASIEGEPHGHTR